MSTMSQIVMGTLILSGSILTGWAQEQVIEFDSPQWEKPGSAVVEYLGRKSLRGGGFLKEVTFTDGVIEVDMAMDGRRSFPGVIFRMQSPQDCEYFYLRPHRTGTPVAVQYTPMFKGLDAWQLYHGPGFTAPAEIPHNRWVHLRLEIKGTQARAFLDDAPQPVLVIEDLKRGAEGGTLGLIGPPNGSIHFSNFRFHADSSLVFPASPKPALLEGLLTRWQLSQPFVANTINFELAPEEQSLPELQWEDVEGEASGLVNISRWVPRTGQLTEVVLARTTIDSQAPRRMRLDFGYSDTISVFLNGKLLFTGDSSFLLRDAQFYGAVGLYDSIVLDLRKGPNELLFMVAENFGGWGYIARLRPPVRGEAILGSGVERAWATPARFQIPESVAFDSRRGELLVSNLVRNPVPGLEPVGFVSKLGPDGAIRNLTWISGLDSPTGIAVAGDLAYIVERGGLVEADLNSGKIRRRIPAPGAVFLNDVAADGAGNVFVSDSGRGAILKLEKDQLAVWLAGPEVMQPNGLYLAGDRLVYGNNGDRTLKAVDLKTKQVQALVRLTIGTIDGIAGDGAGNLIVSHWEGEIMRVRPSGEIESLVDTRASGFNTADLAFDPEKKLLLVPTFFDNRVFLYRLNP